MPIVRLSRALKDLDKGSQIEIQATDPAFQADLEAWIERMGHRLDEFHGGPVQRALITKGG